MPTCQNNKYKNIIHSQKLLLSNKDETISLLNERIEKLETQKELNELKQRIRELKKQNKQCEECVITKSNRLMKMMHKFDKQERRIDELEFELINIKSEYKNVTNELALKVARLQLEYEKISDKRIIIGNQFIENDRERRIVNDLIKICKKVAEKHEQQVAEAEKYSMYQCCICEEWCDGFGNNPYPLKEEGECCDKCNTKVVMERVKKNVE